MQLMKIVQQKMKKTLLKLRQFPLSGVVVAILDPTPPAISTTAQKLHLLSPNVAAMLDPIRLVTFTD